MNKIVVWEGFPCLVLREYFSETFQLNYQEILYKWDILVIINDNSNIIIEGTLYKSLNELRFMDLKKRVIESYNDANDHT